MDRCAERSTSKRSRVPLPVAALISARAASPRPLSRHARITTAPSLANPSAVAFPRPELAPVTIQTFPFIEQSSLLASKGLDGYVPQAYRMCQGEAVMHLG